MNLADYRSAVRVAMGLAPNDAVLSDDKVNRAINSALKIIASLKDWPWLYVEEATTTTADSPLLPLSSDFTRSLFITVDGRYPLEPAQFLEMAGDRATKGRPTQYVVEANQIRLFPTPSEAWDVVHAFYRTEPALVTDIQAPLLPDAYSEWLVAEAAVKLAIHTGNSDRLAANREEAIAQRKNSTDSYVRTQSPGRIRRTKAPIWPGVW